MISSVIASHGSCPIWSFIYGPSRGVPKASPRSCRHDPHRGLQPAVDSTRRPRGGAPKADPQPLGHAFPAARATEGTPPTAVAGALHLRLHARVGAPLAKIAPMQLWPHWEFPWRLRARFWHALSRGWRPAGNATYMPSRGSHTCALRIRANGCLRLNRSCSAWRLRARPWRGGPPPRAMSSHLSLRLCSLWSFTCSPSGGVRMQSPTFHGHEGL